MKPLRRVSLMTKTIMGVGVLVLIFGLGLVSATFVGTRQMLYQQMEAQVQAIADILNYAFEISIRERDFDSIQRIVENARTIYGVGRVSLVDRDFRIIADNRHEEIGNLLTGQAQTVVEDALAKERSQFYYEKEGEAHAFYIIAPLRGSEYLTAYRSNIAGVIVMKKDLRQVDLLITQTFLNAIAIQLIPLLLITVVLVMLFRNVVLQPLRALQAGTHAIAAGDLSKRVMLTSTDEIGEVTHSFNQMAESLNKSKEEIEKYSQLLEAKIEELKERKQELEEEHERLRLTNVELERLNKMKSEFLSTISHELFTPLTTIEGYISFMLEKRAGPLTPEQTKGLDIAQKKVEHLNRLIAELLDVSRIEAGKYRLRVEDVNASVVVHECVESFRHEADAKQIMLEERIFSAHLYLQADIDKLTEVFTNLVGNSLKFTPPGGRIVVMCQREGDQVKFSVADTGIGMAQDKVEKVFESFYQIESSSKRRFGGVGLGLAITKRVIEMHGGKIWIETAEGKGTTVFFTLPQKVAQEVQVDDQKDIIIKHKISHQTGAVCPKVLVVDDDPETLEFTKLLLESERFEVITAHSGAQCLDQLFSQHVDLVMLDLLMPEMDGFEVGRMIRASEQSREVPILAFSALRQKKTIQKALREFADGFVPKPFHPQELLQKLESLLPSVKSPKSE